MANQDLATTIEDHALEQVPQEDRKNWLWITWNSAGLITTLVMLFFGALVCFVAGVKTALLAGAASFCITMPVAWALARIAYTTGYSSTLITRQYGLGNRGSALASIIFASFIVGFLALENALLYRGVVFYFGIENTLLHQVLIYGGLTLVWILLTTFGFVLVSRVSSIMLIAFLLVLAYVLADILTQTGSSVVEVLDFGSQFPADTLLHMGIRTDLDKFIFGLNILIGPATGLALNNADFGRYGKSTAHIGTAVTIAIFMQSLVIMLVGGMLMYAGAGVMVDYYHAGGMSLNEAHRQVLRNPDSIAATFMVFAGTTGFVLMFLAQAKAQVLNAYSSSLCLANLVDAVTHWRPGRFFFVILANVIALLMLYGHILEYVESWIRLLGVMLSAISGVIILDYYLLRPRLEKRGKAPAGQVSVNWAGVISVLLAVLLAHFLLKPYIRIEVLTSYAFVFLIYLPLRLFLARGDTGNCALGKPGG
ncbi:MAG: purine-cytosine permease family protein [Gammaproteobacteria bacterium]